MWGKKQIVLRHGSVRLCLTIAQTTLPYDTSRIVSIKKPRKQNLGWPRDCDGSGRTASSWGCLGILVLLLITNYCQTSSMRESVTENLCETCLTFGGKGRKRGKKDEVSGRAGDDKRVICNVYECTDTTCQVPMPPPPPPRQQKQGMQVSVKGPRN